jgi:hypothetical protein
MVGLTLVLLALVRRLRRASADPEFRLLAMMTAALLVVGTAFYANVEGWSVLDALYFSVITLATVGYGDLAPVTSAGKIFTMGYLLLGIGVIVAFADRLMRSRRAEHQSPDAQRGETTGKPRASRTWVLVGQRSRRRMAAHERVGPRQKRTEALAPNSVGGDPVRSSSGGNGRPLR